MLNQQDNFTLIILYLYAYISVLICCNCYELRFRENKCLSLRGIIQIFNTIFGHFHNVKPRLVLM